VSHVEFARDALGIFLPNTSLRDIRDAVLYASKHIKEPRQVELIYVRHDLALDDAGMELLATKFPNLRLLFVSNCSLVTSLEPLRHLGKLEIVRLHHCHNLASTEPLKALIGRRSVVVRSLEVKHLPGRLWSSWAR
jgi:hypothetical protein